MYPLSIADEPLLPRLQVYVRSDGVAQTLKLVLLPNEVCGKDV
ncbi:MAG: hypothetical protein OXG78_07070 [Chloroflexi bacterium]|nr:hypothetical protein [Chloroflexota bacterium]